VALGGFVLLGGRAADLLGRRRMLMVGLAVFGLGSLGAVLVTAGLSSAVVTVSRAATVGWTSTATLGSAALSLGVLGAFVLVELRSDDPLVRLSILRRRAVRAANVGAMLVTAAVAPMLLLLTLYLQQVLGLSPLRAGLAYVTIAATTTLCSALASRLVSRLGPKPVLATGLALLAIGLGSFSRAPMDGSYLRDLLPGFVVVAIGMAFSFVSVNAAVLSGVDARDAGLGSGLVGTSQSVGAGLGLALLSSIATAHADAAERAGAPASVALNGGLQAAFGVGALVALVGVAVVVLVFRRESEDARSADASGVATAAAPA
jgi:MFS family permease